MRETNNVSVKISSATIKAEDLCARVGLTADSSWAAGQAYGAFGATHPKHGIGLESKLAPSASLDDHVREMLRRLAPSAQKLGQLGAEVEVAFSCAVQVRRAPALHFDRDTLRWLAVMNARLDIDTAVISEPPRPAAGAAGKPPAA